ncbi:MAG: glycosyltransferase family 4 protein [Deltaproteobacteria bacterium]|nr:glycosyltransferase family 4 protein [Deltaproteobacteria bacterium]
MKIALGIRNFSPAKGGAERYLVELTQFLVQEGHEVHVFTHSFDKRIEGLYLHNVTLFPFPKGLRILSFASKCHKLMKRDNFDVIIGVGNTWQADLLQPHGGVHWKWFWRSLKAYQSPWLWGAKFLGRVLSPKQWIEGIVEDAPYRTGVKQIVAISEMVKRDIVDYYGIPEKKVVVIYNGVDTEYFHPRNKKYRKKIRSQYGLGAQDVVLIFVAHNFRLKGLRCLIQALPLIKKKNEKIKLLVVGRDNNDPYRRLAKKMGCESDVFFAGGVRYLERYYPSADILVHPTFYDACSLVVLEALASGVPVITTQYNGAGGIIADGKEGFVLEDPRKVEILAKKILYFADPIKLKEASSAARNLAKRYPLKTSYGAMLKTMQSIASKDSQLRQL